MDGRFAIGRCSIPAAPALHDRAAWRSGGPRMSLAVPLSAPRPFLSHQVQDDFAPSNRPS